MFEPKHKPRTWGFRFFATDAVAIGAFGMAAFVLHRIEQPLWWMLVIVAGHFFLFCNVVRARRSFEVAWAGLFLVNSAVWLWTGDDLDWLRVILIQLPITAGLVIAELRSDRYHGVFARRTNPRLDDYLKGRIP